MKKWTPVFRAAGDFSMTRYIETQSARRSVRQDSRQKVLAVVIVTTMRECWCPYRSVAIPQAHQELLTSMVTEESDVVIVSRETEDWGPGWSCAALLLRRFSTGYRLRLLCKIIDNLHNHIPYNICLITIGTHTTYPHEIADTPAMLCDRLKLLYSSYFLFVCFVLGCFFCVTAHFLDSFMTSHSMGYQGDLTCQPFSRHEIPFYWQPVRMGMRKIIQR